MKHAALLARVLVLLCATGSGHASEWTRSMLWIEATAIRYSHYQPWSRSTRTTFKNGLVVEDGKVLSTAEGLDNATLLRVRGEGDGHWRLARIEWLDPHANLALLSAGGGEAWPPAPAAPLARRVPDSGAVRIRHFLDGRVVSGPGTVRRVHVPRDPQRVVRHMMLEVSSDLDPRASDPDSGTADDDTDAASQIVTSGDEVIGLGAGHDGKLLEVIPAPFIAELLERKRRDPDAALAWYPFAWQGTESPATTAYLGLPGPPRGVVVSAVPALSAFSGLLRARAVVLSIDGFEVESDGHYLDPAYGYLPLGNLSTRGKFAGDTSIFEVWRDGKTSSIALSLPRARYSEALVPDRVFDRSPEYVVAGGLVFQPLTADYLRSWGDEWRKSAPFRLRHYLRQPPLPERRHLVMLSQVLPDPFNLGYRDFAFRIVDRINGRPIATLRDLEPALRGPREGFHVIELLPERGPTRLVLDAAGLDEATERVVRKYGLPEARVVH